MLLHNFLFLHFVQLHLKFVVGSGSEIGETQPNIPQDNSPDPRPWDDNIESPLFAAVRSGQPSFIKRECVELLLKGRASPNLLNKR